MSANPNGTTQYWRDARCAFDRYNASSGYYLVIFSAWVRAENISKAQTICEFSDGASSTNYLRVALGSGNGAFVQWNGGGGQFSITTNTISADTWTHVFAMVAKEATDRSYIIMNADDANKGTGTSVGVDSAAEFNQTLVGAHFPSSGVSQLFDGHIRDVTVWTGYTRPSDATLLSAAQAIYNSGSRVPASEQTFAGCRLLHSFDLYDDAVDTVTGMTLGPVASAGFDTGENPTDRSSNAITATFPQPRQTIQHASRVANIPVSGQYTHDGTPPTSIEARFNGGSWAVVDASPAGGQFDGTLANQSAGQGTLEVRFSNATGVTDSVANVAVGEVVFAAGQSNISGRGTNQNTASTRASIFSSGTGATTDGFRQMADPVVVDSSDKGSFLTKWADEFDDRYSQLPLSIIVHSVGGTGLVNATDWSKGDAEYQRMLVTMLQSGAIRSGVCSMIWGQGGNDAVNGVSEADYEAALIALHDDFQSDSGTTFDIVVNRIDEDFNAGSPAIRAAQDDAIASESDMYAGYDGGLLTPGDASGHWVTDGQILAAAQALDTAYALTPCGIDCELAAATPATETTVSRTPITVFLSTRDLQQIGKPTLSVDGIQYDNSFEEVEQTWFRGSSGISNIPAGSLITLDSGYLGVEIRYTINGKNPTKTSPKYSGPLVFRDNGANDVVILKARIYPVDSPETNTFYGFAVQGKVAKWRLHIV